MKNEQLAKILQLGILELRDARGPEVRPYRLNLSKVETHPEARQLIFGLFFQGASIRSGRHNIICGLQYGMRSLAAILADRLSLPFVLLEPLKNSEDSPFIIYGEPIPGAQTLLVIDKLHDGKELQKAVDTIESRGSTVGRIITVFNCSHANPTSLTGRLESLFDMHDILKELNRNPADYGLSAALASSACATYLKTLPAP